MVVSVKIRNYVLGQEDPQMLYTHTSLYSSRLSSGLCLSPLRNGCTVLVLTLLAQWFLLKVQMFLDGLFGANTFFTQREVNKEWQSCLERVL